MATDNRQANRSDLPGDDPAKEILDLLKSQIEKREREHQELLNALKELPEAIANALAAKADGA